MKKIVAQVWAGGSIRGAWEIGAAHTLINRGHVPDIITGISVGSLNGLLYAHYLGLHGNPEKAINECVVFWFRNVKSPDDIIDKKSWFRIIRELVTGNFDGLLKTNKLEQLVTDQISLYHVRRSPVQLEVGAVNMTTGLLVYVNKDHPRIKEYTMASTRIPLMMPASQIGPNYYYDGGLRSNAAIGQAIALGADEIHVIANQPENVTQGYEGYGSPMEQIDRVMEITVNNTLNNDIKLAELYNDFTAVVPGFKGKRKIEMKVYRPEKHLEIDIESFTEQDIANMIEAGKKAV